MDGRKREPFSKTDFDPGPTRKDRSHLTGHRIEFLFERRAGHRGIRSVHHLPDQSHFASKSERHAS